MREAVNVANFRVSHQLTGRVTHQKASNKLDNSDAALLDGMSALKMTLLRESFLRISILRFFFAEEVNHNLGWDQVCF